MTQSSTVPSRAALDYLRPGFHPGDRDDRELLSAWRSGLAGGAA
jgi:hypothetical protein